MVNSISSTIDDVYVLKKKDETVLIFNVELSPLLEPIFHVKKSTNDRALLPYSLVATSDGLQDWLERRFVPKNRAFVDKILSTLGNSEKLPLLRLLDITLGLSLTDDYWVVPYESNYKWENYNLYQNQFSETLGLIAFTGHGDEKVSGITSSPEFTTDGALRKCWRRISDEVYLFKGGTEGYANAGLEPYSEFYASQVAKALAVNHVDYGLEQWKNVLCSTCKLFTSQRYSLVSAFDVYGNKRASDILESAQGLTKEHLLDMFMFDAIIVNSDRHFANFGFIRDNDSGVLKGLAPLYDHGISLLNYAMEKYDFKDIETYLASKEATFARIPALTTYLSLVKPYLTASQKGRVRKLFDFEFEKHPHYNLSDDRLKFLSNLVRSRARALLSG